VLLMLAGIGFFLQWDLLVEDIRAARKGGDDSSKKEGPPPLDKAA